MTATVDGIEYQLRERAIVGITTIAYDVIVDGKPVEVAKAAYDIKTGRKIKTVTPDEKTPVHVIEHLGKSGDEKWAVLAGGCRYSAATRPELMQILAKVIHG